MTPERYQRMGVIFDQALDQPPEARAAFLDQVCGTDSELRAEVEKLLRHHLDSDDFLVQPDRKSVV